MAPRARVCEVCYNHRSAYQRKCSVCDRMVNPGCMPERCLAQDGTWDESSRPRRNLCKHCFISMQQAVRPLAASLPRALSVLAERNAAIHRWNEHQAIEDRHDSL